MKGLQRALLILFGLIIAAFAITHVWSIMFYNHAHMKALLVLAGLVSIVWAIGLLKDIYSYSYGRSHAGDWFSFSLLALAVLIFGTGVILKSAPLLALGNLFALPVWGFVIWDFFDTFSKHWYHPKWKSVWTILTLN